MSQPVSFSSNKSDRVKQSEKGASLVEYALLVALIAIVCIVAVRTLGNTISNQFTAMNTQLTAG